MDRIPEGVGAVAAGATISVDDVADTDPKPDTENGAAGALPATVAHRGYSSVAPENTLAALASAFGAGAEYIEIDVHTTADGVPVVMHDPTVDRTTDGTGQVDRLTSDYLETLDAGGWFSPAFAGQPVPTLDDALSLVRASGVRLLLEIKGPETDVEVKRIVHAVVEADLALQTVVQSFDVDVLVAAREYAPEVPRALLRDRVHGDPVEVAQQLGVVAYNPPATALITRPEIVAELNGAGIAVMPYTVNGTDTWHNLAELGVDAVITDRPGSFIDWKERRMGRA